MASGDKIYVARQDTLENVELTVDVVKATIELMDGKMGTTSDTGANETSGTLMGKNNEILNHLQNVQGGYQIFETSGTFTVPAGVYKIWVTACAGGGGGGGASQGYRTRGAGSAGGGGEIVFRKPINVKPAENISITIGTGGTGGAGSSSTGNGGNGSSGKPTIIGEYLTLVGGGGGTGTSAHAITTYGLGGPGAGNGSLGGNGDDTLATDGENSKLFNQLFSNMFLIGSWNIGKGGVVNTNQSVYAGGCGGGSIGNGGDGASYNPVVKAKSGTYGGGGGGGSPASGVVSGGKGGDGVCLIEWGLTV